MPGIRFPWHWKEPLTNKMRLIPLAPYSVEARAIGGRLVAEIEMSRMSVEILAVERCQNRQLFVTYDLNRTRVAAARGGDCNERWLWHGTDSLISIITDGFNAFTYASLAFNAYGFGNYFAPDAKLSDFFIRDARGGHTGEKKVILTRVCCGNIAEKSHLGQLLPPGTGRCQCLDRSNHAISCAWDREMRKLLAKPESRGAPVGHDSITGAGTHTESVVFKDTMAYSAYVVTYKLPGGSLPNPYQQGPDYLLTMEDTANWKLSGNI
jgi:hypothetical protein